MFTKLLPNTVVCEEGGILCDECGLFPEEKASVGTMTVQRRREFMTGRTYAHAVIRRLGMQAGPILVNEDRSPRWQQGIVGSITHSADRCAVAVALSEHVAGIGIDIERISDTGDDIKSMLGPEESRALEGMAHEERYRMMCLLFSAKESFFKMQYPLTGRWLEFDDVTARILDGERFEIRDHPVVDKTIPNTVCGHYRMQGDHVYTAVYLARG